MSKNNHEVADPYSYQWSFVEWMTSLDARAPVESGLSEIITKETLNRLETYQSSFLSRVSSNLSETLFEACENLFGVELVAQVLGGYFKFNPPTAESITDAPAQLPEYLRANAQTKEALLFADIAEVCIQRWRILTSIDPHANLPSEHAPLDQVKLIIPSTYIHATGHHDLAAAWDAAATQKEGQLSEVIFENCAGLLLAKTSPTDLFLVRVPKLLNEFARALISGLSVEQSVEAFEQSVSGDGENCLDLLSEFMAKLQAQRVLTQHIS